MNVDNKNVAVGHLVLAWIISLRMTRDPLFGPEAAVILGSMPMFVILVMFSLEKTYWGVHWSLVLPIAAVIADFYINDNHDDLLVGSFYLALWVFYDAALFRSTNRMTRQQGAPIGIALLVWAFYNLYVDRFIPWGTVWTPSFLVFVYIWQRVITSVSFKATKHTWQDDFAFVLFALVISYGVLATSQPITECMQADTDGCGFGSSKYGTGSLLSNDCKCLTADWTPVLQNVDTGGIFDICVHCNLEMNASGVDCCGMALTTNNVKRLNCIVHGYDKCVCGHNATLVNNETSELYCG